MSDGRDKRKQSLYFPDAMISEIHREAARLDRSISWIVQRCVRVGLHEVRRMPSTTEPVVEG